MAEFRKSLSPEARSPNDIPGLRHGHLIARGHEDENLISELRGVDGARKFFRDRGIKWWTHALSGDLPRRDGYEGPTRNLASSQVSCVNFLLPLASVDGSLGEFIRAIDGDSAEIEPIVDRAGRRALVEFEWAGWDDSLEGPSMSRGAHNTSLDALVIGRNAHGRTAYLIEWKYCEKNFRQDRGTGKKGEIRRNRYASPFASPGSPFNGDALLDDFFFEPFYQIMRMFLLAAKMRRFGVTPDLRVDRIRVIVVCPAANTDYRKVVPMLPLARRFSDTDVEKLVRASLRRADEFSIVAQENIVAHLRKTMPNALADWLAYHKARYGW